MQKYFFSIKLKNAVGFADYFNDINSPEEEPRVYHHWNVESVEKIPTM